MSGRIIVTSADGHAAEGGGPRRRDAQPRKTEWDRFTLTFADGGSLVLFDKRRHGTVGGRSTWWCSREQAMARIW